MKLRLDPVRRQIESMMIDTILITRDERGVNDEIFNKITGQYEIPDEANAREAVYEGIGLVWEKREPQTEVYNGDYLITPYGLLIPKDAPALREEDQVTIETSVNDPQLIGRSFWVVRSVVNTYAVMREVHLVERVPVTYPK